MRRNAALAAVLLALLAGCAAPAGLQTADEHFAAKDYLKAAEAYEQVLASTEDSGTRTRVEAKLTELKGLITDDYLLRAGEKRGALTEETVPALGEIVALLESAERWDDGGRLAARIDSLRQEADGLAGEADGHLLAALEAARGFNFDEALDKAGRAAALDPSRDAFSETARNIEKQRGIVEKVSALFDTGDLDGGLKKFEKLAATYSTPLSLSETPFGEKAVELITEEAGVMAAENRWVDALEYLRGWEMPALDEQIRRSSREGAEHYISVAATALQEENPYKAYLYALRAAGMDPKNTRVFDISKKARDEVDDSIQNYIAVASFDSPSNEPDAGRQFSDSLISFLYGVLPYGINILERDKIDYLLDENRERAEKLGEMLGADLVVTGTVSLFKVDSDIDKRAATVKVTVGEETVENPEFTQMARLHGPDTTLWPEVPPRTIKKGNVQLLQYTKGTGQKKGFAKVSVRIFDTSKGTITFVKDYDANLSKTSEFQDEVADAGIEYIPLNLPSDTEIQEEMRKGIVEEIAQVVQASFEKREARFLNQVRFFLDRREYGAALEPLAMGHLYSLQDNIDQSGPEFTEITRLIEEQVR